MIKSLFTLKLGELCMFFKRIQAINLPFKSTSAAVRSRRTPIYFQKM